MSTNDLPGDPYLVTREHVLDPPTTLREIVKRIGPGMILAASIVGSGELIATTTLGAQEGYVLLWLILLSCVTKPIVQAELGRYTIATGEPSLESFDRIPGPRFGLPWKRKAAASKRVSWVVWCWAIMVLLTMLQVGAMFGGIAQVMHQLFPWVPMSLWVVGLAALTLALLLGGGYNRVERLAMVKVGIFTVLTVLAAALLGRRAGAVSWDQVASGLTFQMPSSGLATAIAVFGVTGVGTAELFIYPYWCVEKGYARYAGYRDGSPAWISRARGWVRVMHVDIMVSLVIYTVATIAFYLLGAGVLHRMGLVPKGNDMIVTLSKIYTETLGGWALAVFYAGALVTLYGTIFAGTAANSRIFADMARLLGAFARDDQEARIRYRKAFVWILTLVPAALYMVARSPVAMVIAGATAQSIMLPIAALGTLYLSRRHLPRELHPSRVTKLGLWIATAAILAVMLYGFVLYIV